MNTHSFFISYLFVTDYSQTALLYRQHMVLKGFFSYHLMPRRDLRDDMFLGEIGTRNSRDWDL